jgi:hypothetical protein
MFRKLVFLLACWLGFSPSNYSQNRNYTSVELKSLAFSNPVDRSVSFAPLMKAHLAMDLTPKLFAYGSIEYQKYSYLPANYPTNRSNFLVGFGYKAKTFSFRTGLGTGENFDYLYEIVGRAGDNVDLKKHTWFIEGYLRSGQDNVQKKPDSTKVDEILFGGCLAYKISKEVELGVIYNNKKTQINGSPFYHWWGGRGRVEVEENWYITGEAWEGYIFSLGVQIILM